MNKVREGTNDYLAQIVLIIIGAVVQVLVTVVPDLAQYQEIISQLIWMIVAAILGISVQKGLQKSGK